MLIRRIKHCFFEVGEARQLAGNGYRAVGLLWFVVVLLQEFKYDSEKQKLRLRTK